jgi:hypothetical protein
MKGAQELIWGVVRMTLVAAGVFYAVQVLITYAQHETYERPQFDEREKLRSTMRLLIWAGVMTVWITVRLARPVVNMLSEASAEVGEWAISHRPQQATLRSRAK